MSGMDTTRGDWRVSPKSGDTQVFRYVNRGWSVVR
jgi:hypothetical protein